MRTSMCLALLALLLLPLSRATCAELAPLSAVELHKLCQEYARVAESTEGSSCGAYLRGFIEGSALVELQLPEAVDESFTERAFRTRYGGHTHVRHRYCVNSSVTLSDLIIQLLVQAESNPPRGSDAASTLIEATLNRFHRCDARRTTGPMQ